MNPLDNAIFIVSRLMNINSFEVGTIKSTDRMDLRNVISDIVGCGGAPRLFPTLPNG